MYPKIKKIKKNDELKGLAEIYPDIVYSLALPQGIKMSIISPQKYEGSKKKYPCIVFVQGSAWTFPNIYYEIPQLSRLASEGYIIATITHRNSMEGHPFPACLEDVKTAIRFLRANKEEYAIDDDRIGIWGTSSGGNLSLLTGVTIDEERYKTCEYKEYSDKVNIVVDCFGPTNLYEIAKNNEQNPLFDALSGGNADKADEIMKDMSPILQLKGEKEYPKFLLVHGSGDDVVPFSQSVDMYKKLEEFNIESDMIEVEGAPHEGSFWSDELLDMIFGFIKKNL